VTGQTFWELCNKAIVKDSPTS